MVKGFLRVLGLIFAGLWRAVNGLRRLVFNLVFLFLIAVVIAFVWQPPRSVPDGSALLLRPTGALVEQTVIDDPIGLLRAGVAPVSQTALHDLLDAVNSARDDERIKALVIETDGMGAASLLHNGPPVEVTDARRISMQMLGELVVCFQ